MYVAIVGSASTRPVFLFLTSSSCTLWQSSDNVRVTDHDVAALINITCSVSRTISIVCTLIACHVLFSVQYVWLSVIDCNKPIAS
jgi:hypothetical protein